MLLWIRKKKRRNILQRNSGREGWAQEGGDSWGKCTNSTSWLLVGRLKMVVKRVRERWNKKDCPRRWIIKRRVTILNFAVNNGKNCLWRPKDRGNNGDSRKADGLKVDEKCAVMLLSCVLDRLRVTLQWASVPLLYQVNGLSRDFNSPFKSLKLFCKQVTLKAMYHYRLYSQTQSKWALGVAAGKCMLVSVSRKHSWLVACWESVDLLARLLLKICQVVEDLRKATWAVF